VSPPSLCRSEHSKKTGSYRRRRRPFARRPASYLPSLLSLTSLSRCARPSSRSYTLSDPRPPPLLCDSSFETPVRPTALLQPSYRGSRLWLVADLRAHVCFSITAEETAIYLARYFVRRIKVSRVLNQSRRRMRVCRARAHHLPPSLPASSLRCRPSTLLLLVPLLSGFLLDRVRCQLTST
jgi:hypothetical protein